MTQRLRTSMISSRGMSPNGGSPPRFSMAISEYTIQSFRQGLCQEVCSQLINLSFGLCGTPMRLNALHCSAETVCQNVVYEPPKHSKCYRIIGKGVKWPLFGYIRHRPLYPVSWRVCRRVCSWAHRVVIPGCAAITKPLSICSPLHFSLHNFVFSLAHDRNNASLSIKLTFSISPEPLESPVH